MTIIDCLIIIIAALLMEARNCYKRAEIWEAIAELERRKKSLDGQPHILMKGK